MFSTNLDNIETTGFAQRSGISGAGSSAGSAGSASDGLYSPGGPGSYNAGNQLFKAEGNKTLPVTALIISGLIFAIAIYLYYR